MAVEYKRRCGFRVVGGIYLVCDGEGVSCDRLPFDISTCPTCGHGPKPTRSFSWLPNPAEFFGGDCEKCVCPMPMGHCPVCMPPEQPQGLIWLGRGHYTAAEWLQESADMGISRKISGVPKGFKIGEHWVYVAEREETPKRTHVIQDMASVPAHIVSAFKPQRIEVLITQEIADDPKQMERLEKRGLTPIIVPVDDKDHNPKGYDKIQLRMDLDRKLGKEDA